MIVSPSDAHGKKFQWENGSKWANLKTKRKEQHSSRSHNWPTVGRLFWRWGQEMVRVEFRLWFLHWKRIIPVFRVVLSWNEKGFRTYSSKHVISSIYHWNIAYWAFWKDDWQWKSETFPECGSKYVAKQECPESGGIFCRYVSAVRCTRWQRP